ncbi:MAG TPA: poly-gamma-glutamate biosynthesis protein PgsC/CapC, partial [Planctomycetota bacterium]|nr:poly-gamma-glutamate biosynthesis protein PgsC/CapC [Planctomycetota bacterium]
MDLLPLPIFPERALAESVITTVWIGIFVVCFFNLRLGWPFSGLVVPGYLVPLMIAKPAAFGVICIEGFLTYLLVRWVCDRFHVAGLWSSFFGRDRFFALIVGSLLVRLLLDGWLLPLLGEFINRQFQVTFDYRNNLSSFGLIIVALVSNQFWKTGFWRGQIPFWTTNLLTFALVRFVLMEYTNFNIGNLEYMYENISSSLVASPKAYIVLLTCGFVASRMNLLYGWEFNGILIPSLLAAEWYHPSKILTTVIESFVILGVGTIALRAPCFERMTMEGARKLLLFFNVSFLYKLVLGHIQQGFITPT